MGGDIIIWIVGYFAGATLYAYLHMRITGEDDPVIGVINSILWPILLPFMAILAAAKLGTRK